MTAIAAQAWEKEMEDARAALHEKLGPLKCLRCKEDKFLLRMWLDESLVPGIADDSNNRVVELICEHCGFQEKHVVNRLAVASSR